MNQIGQPLRIILGGVIDDGTVTFKTVTLYETVEYHDSSTLTVTNGSIAEPTYTYWVKSGKWVHVFLAGVLTNDGASIVDISGLPKPAHSINAPLFSTTSHNSTGIYSLKEGNFNIVSTGTVEKLYGSFTYITNE